MVQANLQLVRQQPSELQECDRMLVLVLLVSVIILHYDYCHDHHHNIATKN